MVEAVYCGLVIGRGEHTLVIEGSHYFPPDDVDPQYLRRSRMKGPDSLRC